MDVAILLDDLNVEFGVHGSERSGISPVDDERHFLEKHL
jgi:hypothetical protein